MLMVMIPCADKSFYHDTKCRIYNKKYERYGGEIDKNIENEIANKKHDRKYIGSIAENFHRKKKGNTYEVYPIKRTEANFKLLFFVFEIFHKFLPKLRDLRIDDVGAIWLI